MYAKVWRQGGGKNKRIGRTLLIWVEKRLLAKVIEEDGKLDVTKVDGFTHNGSR